MGVITMKKARAMFADRKTVEPAEYEYVDGVATLVTPRKRARCSNTEGFRKWARWNFFRSTHDLSPKLAKIVAGL